MSLPGNLWDRTLDGIQGFTVKFLQRLKSVRKLALQSQHPYLSGGNGSIQVYRRGNKSELTFCNSDIPRAKIAATAFETVRAKRLRRGYNGPVKNFVCGIVIAQGQITSSKI